MGLDEIAFILDIELFDRAVDGIKKWMNGIDSESDNRLEHILHLNRTKRLAEEFYAKLDKIMKSIQVKFNNVLFGIVLTTP